MIRNASHEDLDAILEIENGCFTRPWSRKSFEAELFKIRSDFLVCEECGEVAGYIVFWYILDEAELADVAVAEKFRRRCGISATGGSEVLAPWYAQRQETARKNKQKRRKTSA